MTEHRVSPEGWCRHCVHTQLLCWAVAQRGHSWTGVHGGLGCGVCALLHSHPHSCLSSLSGDSVLPLAPSNMTFNCLSHHR